jgi:hypothetical protein
MERLEGAILHEVIPSPTLNRKPNAVTSELAKSGAGCFCWA